MPIPIVLDCDPGHDDAIALLLALASPELELLGVTPTVEIELESELGRGRTVVDRWGRTDRAPNANVGVDLDAEGFFDLLVERISSLGLRAGATGPPPLSD